MSLRCIDPGLFTTVQDPGQPGRRAWGVPLRGPFDRESHAIANALVGNEPGCSTLELTGFGGEFETETPLALGFAGADMPLQVDGISLRPHGQSFTLRPGQRLRIGYRRRGWRGYLAVIGGWTNPRKREQPLRTGDLVLAESSQTVARWILDAPDDPSPIRLIDGPDVIAFEPISWSERTWRVHSSSTRMGIILEGAQINLAIDPNRVSTPVLPGSIQLAGGLPILLGVAGGTMGGYPHVGQVITADLDRLGQLAPGDEIQFHRIEVSEARRLDHQRRIQLTKRLRTIRSFCSIGRGH